jgi:hypothetical protein
MPQTVTITSEAYDFGELSDEAKEKARDWYRGCIDEYDFSCEVDEFITIGEAIGIDFTTHTVNLMGGGTRQEPNIWYDISCCQGNGACFEGTYTYKATAEQELRAINNDDSWVPIEVAQGLAAIQLRNAFGLQANICKRDHHYCPEHTVSIELEDRRNYHRCDDEINAAEKEIGELMVDLMCYLYRQLSDQRDYLYSDEAVDESIEANEYKFDEDGRRHRYA